MTITNLQCRLAQRPAPGLPDPSIWSFTEETVADEAPDGQVTVEVLYCSLDPAMRTWLNAGRSYVPPVRVGDVMRATGIGRVLTSGAEGFSPGDIVSGLFGIQAYAVLPASQPRQLDAAGLPLPVHLGALGISGLTAYFGLLDIGKAKQGETVVVSAAAGSVGSVAAQIAKAIGCRVVGIAGGAEKCRLLVDELGLDAAVDYKADGLNDALKAACPTGIDVYFDNVGGAVLNAVLRNLATGARIVISGAVSQYNATDAGIGPTNYMNLLVARASMTGFVIFDYEDRYAEGRAQLAKWIEARKISPRTHLVKGIANFPAALNQLFAGENTGKFVLEVAEP
jgi:NADPH-dependent curcumin reductase CurA